MRTSGALRSSNFIALLILVPLHARGTEAHAAFVPFRTASSPFARVPPLRGSVVSSILRTKPPNRPARKGGTAVISTTFLAGAAMEALLRQRRILEALDEQRGKPVDAATDTVREDIPPSMIKRREKVELKVAKLKSIMKDLEVLDSKEGGGDMHALLDFKSKLTSLGFQHLLDAGEISWTHTAAAKEETREFGRPSGFQGLVFASPGGVPVLVGREAAHADEVLRRVAAGSDLWFQVEDYAGSRVLLRTSLVRGMKDSRSCRQFAADLAAYYSSYRDWSDVPVMYTDSKKVAKRGSKAGQMRKRKCLGRIFARPNDVAGVAKGREPR